jgi:hypothetical protein
MARLHAKRSFAVAAASVLAGASSAFAVPGPVTVPQSAMAAFDSTVAALQPGQPQTLSLSVPFYGTEFSPPIPGRVTRIRVLVPPGWTSPLCGGTQLIGPATALPNWSCVSNVFNGISELTWSGTAPTGAIPADTRQRVTFTVTPPNASAAFSAGAAGSTAPGFWVDARYTQGFQSIVQAWRSPNAAGMRKGLSSTGLVLGVNAAGSCFEGSGQSLPSDQCIQVSVGDFEMGEFVWSISGDRFARLSRGTNQPSFVEFFGDLDPVVVSDTRLGGPSWSVAGHVDEFSGGLSGRILGWDPVILDGQGADAAVAGPVVQAALPQGTNTSLGLLRSSLLASALPGHPRMTVRIGAALTARVPADTPAGDYTAVLTLTALS